MKNGTTARNGYLRGLHKAAVALEAEMANLQLIGLRTLAGYASRAAVAKAAGLSEPTCWRIETGSMTVRPESLVAYAEKLGIAMDELVMLRQPDNQGQMFLAARVLVLPVVVWGEIDRQAIEGNNTVHSTIARLVVMPV